jgi:hypothetical protein
VAAERESHQQHAGESDTLGDDQYRKQ